MCSLIICHTCKKYSFVGCGQHLTKIFFGKKTKELCQCNEKIKEYIQTLMNK